MGYFDEIVFFRIETGDKCDEIIDQILEKKYITDAARLNSKIKKECIYALSLDGITIKYLAKGKKTGKIATHMDRLKFTNFFEIDINIAEITESIKKIDDRLTDAKVNRLPPGVTRIFIEYLTEKEPDLSNWLNNVKTLKDNPYKNNRQEELDDAFQVALKISGFNFKDNGTLIKTSGTVPVFLENVNRVQLSEDEMINHDLTIFNDWEKIKSNLVGMACFEKHNEKLFIWNINRKPLESVLGVDLIYYIEKYQSFIMIQYKRMLEENGAWIYRPTDKSYKRELTNMRRFEEKVTYTKTDHPNDFRLNECPFFFKLCPSTVKRDEEINLIRGMYVPFEYWEEIIKDNTYATGKNGGTAVTFENIGRYLTNTEFTALAQKAWIGSTVHKSKQIEELVSRAIQGDNAVALAALVNT